MTTPPGRDEELAAIIVEQVARMRRRTAGKLPPREQEELAALLEDLLRAHPVLSRWTERLVSPPNVLESGNITTESRASTPETGRDEQRPPVAGGRGTRKSRKVGGSR